MLTVLVDGNRVVSECFGKVMISGGYCVLNPSYTGLVVCYPRASGNCYALKTPSASFQIEVSSINFPSYSCKAMLNSSMKLDSLNESTENVFINKALIVCLEYVSSQHRSCKDSPFSISMQLKLADCFYGSRESDAKTGLGSSAVVTVLLISSLLGCFDVPLNNSVIFALAYRAHCIAQGKVGSGFDISSCIYGSQLFQRNPHCNDVLEEEWLDSFEKKVCNISPIVHSFFLQSHYELGLIAVGSGTKTVSFVRQVNEWTATNPEVSKGLFEEIDTCTRNFYRYFSNNHKDLIKKMAKDILELYCTLSTLSSCPIVPKNVHLCIKKLLELDCVSAAGIAGAGGYDAFYVIFQKGDEKTIIECIKEFSFRLLIN